MKVRLYSYWRSSASYRARIALALKGVAYEQVNVHLLRGGGEQLAQPYRDVNPMAQVPTLEIEEDGRVYRLAQSLAICRYLDRRWPEPLLVPKGAEEEGTVWELAELVNSGIQPLQNLTVLRKLKELVPTYDSADWMRHFVTMGLAALEARAKETAGRFLVGDQVSLADVCLVPQMFSAARFGVDTTSFPTLRRVNDTAAELPAFVAAHPAKQPDAEKT